MDAHLAQRIGMDFEEPILSQHDHHHSNESATTRPIIMDDAYPVMQADISGPSDGPPDA